MEAGGRRRRSVRGGARPRQTTRSRRLPDGSTRACRAATKALRAAAAERLPEWRLGPPDLVVTLEQPYTLEADGPDVFRNFAIPIPVDGLKFVAAVDFSPGGVRAIHHANLRFDQSATSRELDAEDKQPGYEGAISMSARYPDGYFLGWTPGQSPLASAPGMAWRLGAGTDLVVQLHLRRTGKPERDPAEGRVLLHAGRTDTHAAGAAARQAEHRHQAWRAVSGRRRVSTARRRRAAGDSPACALPREGDPRDRRSARRHAPLAPAHRRLGFQLAGRLPVRRARRPPERHDDPHALHLRQLRREPAQSGSPAAPRHLRAELQRRNGRSVAAGGHRHRRRPRGAVRESPAQDPGRGRRRVRDARQRESRQRRLPQRPRVRERAAGPVRRGDPALRCRRPPEARLGSRRSTTPPRCWPRGAATRRRCPTSAGRSRCVPITPRRTTTSARSSRCSARARKRSNISAAPSRWIRRTSRPKRTWRHSEQK